jgi:hypothetical protein
MFTNCLYDPKKGLVRARFLLPIGLLVVICGIEWPSVFAPHLHLPSWTNDLIQGFCLGLGIALEIGSVVLMRKFGNCPRTN